MKKTLLVFLTISIIIISCSNKQEYKPIKKIEPKSVLKVKHFIDSMAKSEGNIYTPIYTSKFYKARIDKYNIKKLSSFYKRKGMNYETAEIYTIFGINENCNVSTLNKLPLMDKMITEGKIPFVLYAFIHRYKIKNQVTGETTTYVSLIYTDKSKNEYLNIIEWTLKTE